MRGFILCVLLMLPAASCTLIKDYAKEAAVEVVMEQLPKFLSQEELAKMKAGIDPDGSGVISWDKLVGWFGAGGAGLAGFLIWLLRQRLSHKVGQLWTEIEDVKTVVRPTVTTVGQLWAQAEGIKTVAPPPATT